MSKIKKLIIILQIVMLLLPTTITFASNINIGDEIKIERGPLGFYTIQYWDVTRDEWMYVTYSRTYYTDKDGNKKIAYCVKPNLNGVGWLPGEEESYSTKVEYRLTDERIHRILKNGYPYVSLEALGVETEDDGYLATKQAIYWIIRERKLESIYGYFRPGQTEINGQNLDDIQRRGKKVVDAIYKLVDIGYNGVSQDKDSEKPEIIELNEYKKYEDSNYYFKEYQVKKSKSEIKITETNPEGIKIVDEEGKNRKRFNVGEKLKVLVPKEKIDKNLDIKIKYKSEETTYPVYYTTSNMEERQNYIIIQNKNEMVERELSSSIKGNTSELEIIKIDNESKQPIEGTTFELSYKDGETIGTYTTDKDGRITVKELYARTIQIKEIEANEKYVLNEVIKEANLKYDEKCIIEITNKRKTGNIEIIKTDKDDRNIVLEGVEFELINTDGEIVAKLKTDKQGKAKATNIDAGEYILRETKTKEEYKIGIDQDVVIKHNKTLELEIENEKKKGYIKITKTSEDKNEVLQTEAGSPISGVKFNIFDLEGNFIEELVTDDEGKAESKGLPLGEYIVKETDAGEWYKIDKEEHRIKISEDEEIVELNVTNKSKQPRVNINKNSKNSVKSNEEVDYEFEIMNSGETNLVDFTWYDILPSEYAKITKISTGTYNQDLIYNVCYKTNQKDVYMIAKADLKTTENNYIDLSNIHLEKGEKITEIKINFGDVKVGFSNIEKPHIFMQMNSNLENDTKIKNYTILEGYINNFKVCDEDTAISTIYNIIEKKKLPRTGF